MTPARSQPLDGVSPDAVAERAAACASVARLSAGPVGEVATYLPGRRVPGVRLRGDRIEIHVVAKWGVRIADVAADVRTGLRPLAAGVPVDVYVDDVEVPGEAFEIQLPSDESAEEHR